MLHGAVGSVAAVDCSITCGGLSGGLAWKVVDVPGCNGLHLSKNLLGREVRRVRQPSPLHAAWQGPWTCQACADMR